MYIMQMSAYRIINLQPLLKTATQMGLQEGTLAPIFVFKENCLPQIRSNGPIYECIVPDLCWWQHTCRYLDPSFFLENQQNSLNNWSINV